MIRIREAQKHVDLDSDPVTQHCYFVSSVRTVFSVFLPLSLIPFFPCAPVLCPYSTVPCPLSPFCFTHLFPNSYPPSPLPISYPLSSFPQCSGSESLGSGCFGPSGWASASANYLYGSGSFLQQVKRRRKTLISIVLWLLYDFLSLKDNALVGYRYLQKGLRKKD